MYESDAFPSIIAHKLQTPPNITIGHWNVNSLRNKIKAVEELIKKILTYVCSQKLKLINLSYNQL